jgi:hypothetical protein
MTGSGLPQASPTRASDLFRWVILVLVAGVVLYAGSFAVGLMTPGWDIFRVPPKTAVYIPPPSAPADNSAADVATSARVPAPLPSSQEAELNSPKDRASADSSTSNLAILPAANPPPSADLSAQKDVASGDVAPQASYDAASKDAASKDMASQGSDVVATTSALAPEARPRLPQPGVAVTSSTAADQDSSLPPATLGFAPVSTARDLTPGAEFNARKAATAQPSDASPTAPGQAARPGAVKTTQNSPLSEPVAAPKRRGPSESSRKIWYK